VSISFRQSRAHSFERVPKNSVSVVGSMAWVLMMQRCRDDVEIKTLVNGVGADYAVLQGRSVETKTLDNGVGADSAALQGRCGNENIGQWCRC